MKPFVCLALSICLLPLNVFGFDNEVKPSCPPEEDECEFDWNIDYLLTMTTFNWTMYRGEPINYRNDAFCKRDIFACGTNPGLCTPVTCEELDKVVTADGSYIMIYAINKQFPGPTIVVYENQKVVIHVKNSLIDEVISIHWHGMHQINTPWMDGVSMVSQCPILPGQRFTYRFVADPAGTHWYHSHVGAQRSEGISGALIVLPRTERNDLPPIHSDFVFLVQEWLRYKSSNEMVKIQDWFMVRFMESFDGETCAEATLTHDGAFIGTYPFDGGLINGKGQARDETKAAIKNEDLPIEMFNVTKGSYYRFRIVNSAAFYPFRISVDSHSMEVVSSDGHDTERQTAQSVIAFPGERFDVLLFADASPGNYWIRAETLDVYGKNMTPLKDRLEVRGVLHYEDVEYERPSSEKDCKGPEICLAVNCPFTTTSISILEPYTRCLPLSDLKATKQLLKQYPVPMPRDDADFQEIFLNFHFSHDDFRTRRSAVNGIRFQFPSSPLQLYPNISKAVVKCSKSGRAPFCTHIVKLKKDLVTQMVISVNEGPNSGMTHPIHLHGTAFHVLKYGFPDYDKDTGLTGRYNRDIKYSNDFVKQQWRNSTWEGGNVPGINLENPPLKDTVTIPRRGYVLVRFRANNPGYWFMHCHIENHQLLGMAVLIQIGEESDMSPKPPGIPMCGDFEWSTSSDTLQSYQKYSSVEDCTILGPDYLPIHSTWFALFGILAIVLLSTLFGLGFYTIHQKRKFDLFQYRVFHKKVKRRSSESDILIGQ